MTELIADIQPCGSRIALLENGELAEYHVALSGGETLVGSIYKGKVENVISGMQAAFVNIGLERNAYLYAGDAAGYEGGERTRGTLPINKVVHPGEEIVVQVIKDPVGDKGARVSMEITVPGKSLVFMPFEKYVGVSRKIDDEQERERLKRLIQTRAPGRGCIVRTAAQGCREELLTELEQLEKRWERIEKSISLKKAPCLVHSEESLIMTAFRDIFNKKTDRFVINDPEAFALIKETAQIRTPELKNRIELYNGPDIMAHYQLTGKLERLLDRKVWLDCGAYLIIDRTEALTVIDVNTGKFTGKVNLADTILKTNLQAAREIARQLRLRSIGGIVIIDFIDMENDEQRGAVLEALKQEAGKDRVKVNIVGFTGLGLVELTRKKTEQSLSAVLEKTCPCCDGRGSVSDIKARAWRLREKTERALWDKSGVCAVIYTDNETAQQLKRENDEFPMRTGDCGVYAVMHENDAQRVCLISSAEAEKLEKNAAESITVIKAVHADTDDAQ